MAGVRGGPIERRVMAVRAGCRVKAGTVMRIMTS